MEEGGEDVPLQSALLFPSPENPLLDLFSDPPEIQNLTLASIHSDALSMPVSSYCTGKEGSSEAGSVDPGKAEINFGYWFVCFFIHHMHVKWVKNWFCRCCPLENALFLCFEVLKKGHVHVHVRAL